jgi:hypothetical protein
MASSKNGFFNCVSQRIAKFSISVPHRLALKRRGRYAEVVYRNDVRASSRPSMLGRGAIGKPSW